MTKHVYVRIIDKKQTANTYFQMRGNSVYDPNYDLGGQKIIDYQNYFNFYGRNYVVASKITVKLFANTEGENMRLTLYPSANTTAPAADKEYRNIPTCKTTTTGAYNSKGYAKLTGFATTTGVYQRDRSDWDDPDFFTLLNTNPTKNWVWNIIVQGWLPGSTALRDFKMEIRVKYYTIWARRTLTFQY